MKIRRWPAAVVAGALVVAAGLTWYAIAAHPDALRTPGASYLPLGLGIVFFGYAVVTVVFLRRPRPGMASGMWFGAVAGLLWSTEITGGGLAMLARPAEVAVGATTSLAAVATTLTAGVTGAVRGGRRTGLTVGVWAGLVSALVVYLYALPMTLLNLDLLGTRADYQQQFVTSHAPTMAAFLVQDALTGYGAHLIINPVLGLVGAAIGALVCLGIRQQTGPTILSS